MKIKVAGAACSFVCFVFVSLTIADDTAKKDEDGGSPSITAQVTKDANDAQALNKHFGEFFGRMRTLMDADPDAAEKQLNDLTELLESLEPEADEAKAMLERAKRVIPAYQKQIELARVSLEDLRKKLEANADDAAAVGDYISKVSQQIAGLAQSDSGLAEEQLTAAKKFLASVAEKATDETTKRAIEDSEQTFSSLAGRIESMKKLTALVGKDAAPLAVEAWVNGSPLTDGELKGKVVLLDFWAVWCGPCIATFPHLREWHDEYGDKGLVIIGLTNYYNYAWDEEAGRARRQPGQPEGDEEKQAAKESELKMLEKFAESHDLKHRFAIQKDRSLADYYNVSGIPHVVVIDQEQKVRLMRVGSGEANARAIEETIKQLLSESNE